MLLDFAVLHFVIQSIKYLGLYVRSLAAVDILLSYKWNVLFHTNGTLALCMLASETNSFIFINIVPKIWKNAVEATSSLW